MVKIIGKAQTWSECPACGNGKSRQTEIAGVASCAACGCFHGSCYLGDSYRIALPRMTAEAVPASALRPYDLVAVGSAGEQRRHGWVDTRTGLVAQVG